AARAPLSVRQPALGQAQPVRLSRVRQTSCFPPKLVLPLNSRRHSKSNRSSAHSLKLTSPASSCLPGSLPYRNRSFTSCGIFSLVNFFDASFARTVQTRFSNPSAASTSPRNNLCSTRKLLFPHSRILDSTVTVSPKLDGTKKRALVSTIGIPASPYFASTSCFFNPTDSNRALVHESNISKNRG